MGNNRIWEIHDIPENVRLSFDAGDTSLFIFVLDGQVQVSQCGGASHVLEEGFFFFKPMAMFYEICSLEGSSRLLVCRFRFYAHECIRNFLRQLELADTSSVKHTHGTFKALRMNGHLMSFLNDIAQRLPDSPFADTYYELKLSELFIYLDAYYDKQDLVIALSSIVGKNLEFINEVLSSYVPFRSVNEMAAHFKMERVTFNRHFIASFGMTASKWMRDMRNIELLRMVKTTDLNFSEIAFRLGLSSSAYLTEYCRRCWGKTPTMLRTEP